MMLCFVVSKFVDSRRISINYDIIMLQAEKKQILSHFNA